IGPYIPSRRGRHLLLGCVRSKRSPAIPAFWAIVLLDRPSTTPDFHSVMAEHLVRDEGVAGSNPATPTRKPYVKSDTSKIGSSDLSRYRDRCRDKCETYRVGATVTIVPHARPTSSS